MRWDRAGQESVHASLLCACSPQEERSFPFSELKSWYLQERRWCPSKSEFLLLSLEKQNIIATEDKQRTDALGEWVTFAVWWCAVLLLILNARCADGLRRFKIYALIIQDLCEYTSSPREAAFRWTLFISFTHPLYSSSTLTSPSSLSYLASSWRGTRRSTFKSSRAQAPVRSPSHFSENQGSDVI